MSLDARANDNEESADSGPSLNSEDQQERIEARRLRIAARIEAKRREALGEDRDSHRDKKEDDRKSHKQIEHSRQRLTKLVSDGTELVTNVQIAADARETQRRAEEEELRRLRVEKLDSEAKTSLEKFEEITKKWLHSGSKKIPQVLWELLNSQQKQCGQLIEDKNKLIGDLQQELRRKDDQYVKDLKRQAEDIDILIERMEEQIKNLTKTYREELLEIERTFESERQELLNNSHSKWEKGMMGRRDKELENLMSRMKKVEEYEKQLNQLRLQDGEEYNTVKIKLENDVQILQQQLQQMKATYQLNQEKLEYNYHVLKKRDEENTITKSQQKRRITRHFAVVDDKRFRDIWLMNEEEVKELVHRALEADRIIHEQQLGLPWLAPDLLFMENVGPLVSQEKLKKTAVMLAREVMALPDTPIPSSGAEQNTRDCGSSDQPSPPFSARTVKRILELLGDESGFLIESKLIRLLSPLEKDERSLMKLDSIFTALGIEVEDDVYKLVDFFCNYKQERMSVQEHGGDAIGTSSDDLIGEKPSQSSDLIHCDDVVRALRAFVQECHASREKLSRSRLSEMEDRDASEDAAYWSSAAHVIPRSRVKVWDALESALEKYYGVLSSRSQLITETSTLQQQNTELRMLLHQYLNSKINTELEIPPTQLLRWELPQT
uniref:Dynein regulatory complex protein 1 n=1 Tax=Leptobrachium leishanense TaxID=445787 RepID=A0A8C5MDT7_9ANUR